MSPNNRNSKTVMNFLFPSSNKMKIFAYSSLLLQMTIFNQVCHGATTTSSGQSNDNFDLGGITTSSSSRSQDDLQTSTKPFSPIVTATCRAGQMTIKVETLEDFNGVVQSRDHRKPECSGYGENAKITFLRVNMVAEAGDRDYCGVFLHEETDEYSVAISVRLHKTLETARDKFYMITCGKAGFKNTQNETSLVELELLQDDTPVQQVIYGRDYTLRAHFSKPDGKFGMQVKRCFSFSDTNNTVQLVDDRGCPDVNIISDFNYYPVKGVAEAKLYSMFKFPESNRVHFQCDILICKGPCPTLDCDDIPIPEARSLTPRRQQSSEALLSEPPEDGALMASYSVFVLEPGEKVDVAPICEKFDITSHWIFWVCICLSVAFIALLILVAFLLSALTCSCISDEMDRKNERRRKKMEEFGVIDYPGINTGGSSIGKDNAEEFDPYAKSWHGSQYGSRYSLFGQIRRMPVPYIKADNTKVNSRPSSKATATSAGSAKEGNRAAASSKTSSSQASPITTTAASSSSRVSAKSGKNYDRKKRAKSEERKKRNNKFSRAESMRSWDDYFIDAKSTTDIA